MRGQPTKTNGIAVGIYLSPRTAHDRAIGEKNEILELGAVVAKADKKGKANDIMKEWITDTKHDYIVAIAEEVIEGQPIASFGKYTPSVSAKEGTYIAFGIEKNA